MPIKKLSTGAKTTYSSLLTGNLSFLPTAAPTSVSATDVGTGRAYNNGSATVSFVAPAVTGATDLTYTVTSSPGGFTGTGATSPITVTGLQSNTSYTFTVVATTSAGNSSASSASNAITATTVPEAPTIGTPNKTGITVSGQVNVLFTANATGGKAISTYTATSSGAHTGTGATSPITVSGMTGGTSYTFTVTATNANGTSLASSASASIAASIVGTSTFNASGNFAVPAGITTISYIVTGGGGGGGGGSYYRGGGGGGGGGYQTSNASVTPSTNLVITVGGGGNGGAGGDNGGGGNAGGNSILGTVGITSGGGGGGGGGTQSGYGGGGGAAGSGGGSNAGGTSVKTEPPTQSFGAGGNSQGSGVGTGGSGGQNYWPSNTPPGGGAGGSGGRVTITYIG